MRRTIDRFTAMERSAAHDPCTKSSTQAASPVRKRQSESERSIQRERERDKDCASHKAGIVIVMIVVVVIRHCALIPLAWKIDYLKRTRVPRQGEAPKRSHMSSGVISEVR